MNACRWCSKPEVPQVDWSARTPHGGRLGEKCRLQRKHTGDVGLASVASLDIRDHLLSSSLHQLLGEERFIASQCQIPHSNLRSILAARDCEQTDFPASPFAGGRKNWVVIFMLVATLQ